MADSNQTIRGYNMIKHIKTGIEIHTNSNPHAESVRCYLDLTDLPSGFSPARWVADRIAEIVAAWQSHGQDNHLPCHYEKREIWTATWQPDFGNPPCRIPPSNDARYFPNDRDAISRMIDGISRD